MELIELNGNARDKTGKGFARQLRRDGLIPAILYGPGDEPVSLSVGQKDLENAIKKSTTRQVFLNLKLGDNAIPAMLKDLQRNPLNRGMLHADFYKVNMDRKIKTQVPVKVTGKCIGVELGGMLQVIRRELEVECLPFETPDAIVIDITNLDIGDSIHVEDIEIPGNAKAVAEVNFTVITILSTKKDTAEEISDEEAEGEEAVEGAEAAEGAEA